MIIKYRNNEIAHICNDKRCMRRKFPPSVVEQLKELLYRLAAYEKFDAFRQSNKLRVKYRVHDLIGNKKGLTSLSFGDKCRMTVKVLVNEPSDIITIWEVSSNHYGD